MSDYLDTDSDEGYEPEEHQQNTPKGLRQSLERTAKENRELKERLGALERNLAFTEAGVDRNSPLGQFFSEKYSGELHANAIKAKWLEISGGPKNDPATVEQVTDNDNASSSDEAMVAMAAQALRNPGQTGAANAKPTPIEAAIQVQSQTGSELAATKAFLDQLFGQNQQ